jgi:hypothetical protein
MEEQDSGAPDPEASLPTLDQRQLGVLRRVGRRYSGPPSSFKALSDGAK